MGDGFDSIDEVDDICNEYEFDFYEPSSECSAESAVAIVVCKRPDYVLMYIPERGELCVMLRRYANVGSVAEFDAKFELAEFYDIFFVHVMEQKAFGRLSFKWMCTEDDIQLNRSDWMPSRVLLGGFVQVSVCCNFVDQCITKLNGDFWIVSTDLGQLLFEKSFMEQNELYGKALDLWATFVKEDKECHWQIFVLDNFDAIASSVYALYDELHTDTTATPVTSPTTMRPEVKESPTVEESLTVKEGPTVQYTPTKVYNQTVLYKTAAAVQPLSPQTTSPSPYQDVGPLLRPVTFGDLERLKRELMDGFRQMLSTELAKLMTDIQMRNGSNSR